jgi:hypothetical protein
LIAIEAGDHQTSLRGTELAGALTVRVKTNDGSVPDKATIQFTVTQGGGSVAQTLVTANERGVASTRWTLGMALGTNKVVASAVEAPGVSATFTATSSNFYCMEANDTLQVCGSCPDSYGPKDNLLLLTDRSELHGSLSASVVEMTNSGTATSFHEIQPELGIFPAVIFDAAFSARGDYFVARRTTEPEILKLDGMGNLTHFATLDQTGLNDQVEITSYPRGLLAGCDVRGPFVVGCRDTLLRFTEATFAGGVNNDAVAADPRDQMDDPLGEDIYFIKTSDWTLQRIAVDSLRVEPGRGLEWVADLTQDQAEGARGMVCDNLDGSIYILVDTDNTKELVQFSPGGSETQLFDFTTRGAGDAAGQQRDLAFRRPFLYTLDTLNDNLLLYDIAGTFVELFSDSLEQSKLSKRDNQGGLVGGERVGLAVLK